MDSIQNVFLDLNDPTAHACILYGKQGDAESRQIRISLMENGSLFRIPENITVRFRFLMVDGAACESPAVVGPDHTVMLTLPDQMLEAPGAVIADLSLRNSMGARLSTPSFVIRVDPVPFADAEV